MKNDIKKGRKVKSPFIKKPYLVSWCGFKINGMLLSFSISERHFANILLNNHYRNPPTRHCSQDPLLLHQSHYPLLLE
ncbi:MAG: hypothetical protein ABI337_01920, partial [Nitrososphaera sp.]